MKLQITIDGTAYEVDVEVLEDDESPLAPSYASHQAAAGAPTQSHEEARDSDGKVCRSPVMGFVIKVNVKPGQAVEANELMMVLEAMKMETNLTALRAGMVKNVHAAPGDSVKVNQALVEFE